MHLQEQKHHNIQTYPLKNLYHIPLNIIPVYQAYEPVTIRGMILQARFTLSQGFLTIASKTRKNTCDWHGGVSSREVS